ncbi:hypothetical protein Tco_0212462 [Tanacetum coccineum]
MLPKFSQIVNRLYAFIYEMNHSKSGLGLPSIVALVMVIDKSWTSLGKHEKAFYTGLKKFIDDCKPLVDSAGNIRCPLIDNTRKPQMSDMTACLNDLNYIPLNNEQNELTQGDIDSNTPGKKVPKKVLRYFSIIPRLQRLYKSSHTAKEMTWQHPVDGRAWKDFDTKYPDFAAEPRNVRLGLAADESSFMLTLLIPGPKSPGKDIDVYLRPLIDDLKDLWAKPGVETIDVATGLKFNMRAMDVNHEFIGPDRNMDCLLQHVSFSHEIALVPGQVQEGCQRMLHGGHSGVTGGGKGIPRKPNLGGRERGRQHNAEETRNLGLKAITDKSGLGPIRFSLATDETPCLYEQKAGVMAQIGTQFDMRPHMESDRWPLIYAAIQQHLQKIYNGKKAALKERHWIPDLDGNLRPRIA